MNNYDVGTEALPTPIITIRTNAIALFIDSRPADCCTRCKTVFGGRRFSVVAPRRVWNSLPQELRNCETLGTFKKHLKTHLFRQDIILPATDALQIMIL